MTKLIFMYGDPTHEWTQFSNGFTLVGKCTTFLATLADLPKLRHKNALSKMNWMWPFTPVSLLQIG